MTVAALRRLLADIDTQGGPDAARDNRLALPEPARSTGISFTAVRAWARQHGIPCQPQGRPPQTAIDAWHAANTPPEPTEGDTRWALPPSSTCAAEQADSPAATPTPDSP